jgi:hypothetical protein
MPIVFAFGRKPLATALIAGGLIAFSAPAAHAQLFNFFFHSDGLDPGDVQSMLEDRGLQLVAPLHRNGGVYVADVEGPRGARFRLIVDAESGRVMQRFRLNAPRYYGEYAGPRPPAEVNESESNASGQGPLSSTPGAPPAVITFGQSIARGEDGPNGPNVLSVPSTNEENAKPRMKPQVKQHKKIDLTPLQQPAQNAPPPAPAASDAKQPVHAEAAPAPSGAETKAPAAPQPVAAPPPSAPAATKAKPAINDVPVTPLD